MRLKVTDGAAGMNGRRILIIDDEKDFTASLQDILVTRGFKVAMANSRAEATVKLGDFSPDVCLVDLRLGRANGLDLIDEISRSRRGVLTVLMTAYADTDSAIAALKSGAYDYLRKPFEMEDLFATLERGFERLNLIQDRAEALDALKQTNRDLSGLNARLRSMVEAAGRIAACRREDELQHALLEELATSMAAAGGSLYLLRDNRLELAHSLDPGSAVASIELPLPTENAFARALSQRVPALVKGADAVKRLAGTAWGGSADGSLLLFPLVSSTAEVLGVITLHKKRYPPFSDQDLDLGRIFTSLALEVMRSLQAAEALRESEARYRALFESAGDGIIVLRDGLIVDCNASSLRIFGRAREKMIGAKPWAYSPALQPDGSDSGVNGPALYEGTDGSPRIFEWLFAREDGGSFDAEVACSRIALRGETYVLSIVRDVTARKRADAREKEHERELLQAGKLASLGTLVSGIAHEINNPNNFIRLSVQNIEDLWAAALEVLDADEARSPGLTLRGMPYGSVRGIVQEMLSRIVEGSKRIERLVTSLRDYARRDEGDLGEKVDVNAVVSSALTILSNVVSKATSAFTLELAPSLPLVRGNSQQIEQVVINLLTNACQALRSRSDPVSVRTAPGPDGGGVVITVSDGGLGIPPGDIARITDPFFTTKRDVGGTGLGLSISSRIIQNHGGVMEFSSRPGEGTLATVRLPVSRVSGKEAPA